MGQLSASSLSPVPETELNFNGEQSATVLSTQLCDILEQTICPSVPGQSPFLQSGRAAGCLRPRRQKADDSTMPAWHPLQRRTSVIRTGRWPSSPGRGLEQQTLPGLGRSLWMGLENQESPREQESLCTAAWCPGSPTRCTG